MSVRTGAGFPRPSRLTRSGEYRNVFTGNIRFADDCLTLLVGNKQENRPRLGLAVSKKQVRRAVDRNRIKRLIRTSFRLQQKQLPDRAVVVMVRGKILRLSNREIFQRLHKLWNRVQQQCENY